jgi:hypothetical protein
LGKKEKKCKIQEKKGEKMWGKQKKKGKRRRRRRKTKNKRKINEKKKTNVHFSTSVTDII